MRKRKNEINFAVFDGITEKQCYLIGDIAFIVGHVIYLAMFLILGVNFMAAYNCFSVAFYVVLYFFIKKAKNRNIFIYIAMVEVLVHSCLGVWFMGWGMGFELFMLFIVPIPFFMPNKKFLLPYIMSAVDISLFVVTKLLMTGRSGFVSFDSYAVNNVAYLINSIFGFFIIIYISSIYMIYREMVQYRLTATNESLKKLASVDPLTQLFNRRSMMDFLRMIQSSCKKNGGSYVLAIGDIDDFKRVNDTYGHDMGDEVLRRASKVMTEAVPSEGYVCRWGGEEFLFAVPNAGVKEGAQFAEKVCQRLREEVFHGQQADFGVTMTIGVCQVTGGENFEHSIRIADERLYAGKQSGKNKVVYK
jgi:diguanylate cyclase (GGDEF)-like protein